MIQDGLSARDYYGKGKPRKPRTSLVPKDDAPATTVGATPVPQTPVPQVGSDRVNDARMIQNRLENELAARRIVRSK